MEKKIRMLLMSMTQATKGPLVTAGSIPIRWKKKGKHPITKGGECPH